MDDTAVIRLVVKGILRQVASDLRGYPEAGDASRPSRRVVHAIDAYEFLQGPLFGLICTALDVNPEAMRNELLRRASRGDRISRENVA